MKKETYTFAIMPSSGRRIKTISFSSTQITVILLSFFITVSLSLGIGSLMAWKAYNKQKMLASQASQKYEVLCNEVQQLRKSYSDFANILGIETTQSIIEPGQGGPEMPELNDASIEQILSETHQDLLTELTPILSETAALRIDFNSLSKAVDDNMAQLGEIPSIWPIRVAFGTKAWISSRFGLRRSPFTGAWEMHEGLDIISPQGTPIIATADGVIVKTETDRFLGNHVMIKHNSKFSTLYGHLDQFEPNAYLGAKVKRGEVIGYMGRTGRATGVHVHYEVRVNGRQVDPMDYILN